MNEELKIIISAVTKDAKKGIQDVKKELQGMGKEGTSGGKSIGAALKSVGKAATIAIGAVAAVVTAIIALGKSTQEVQKQQAKLNTAFQAAGSTSEQAAKSYNNLFRFLGDADKATEAAGHLAKLTTNEQHLAEWTTALQGVYATFGDSLPIEGLTEAANETAKVGTVTGTLADALNWAGVSEDAFNQRLAATNSEAEREALIRDTLNSLYSDAAALYEKNNAEMIAANEAQARLDATLASVGKTIQPLLTALTNLSNVLLTALAPAIQVVSSALAWLINAISKGMQYIGAFFGMLGDDSKKAADSFSGVGASVGNAAATIGKAATGTKALGGGLDKATKSAEKLKRVTAGFDELNILSSGSSGADAAGAGAAGGVGGLGAAGGSMGGFALDTGSLDMGIDVSSGKLSAFAEKAKSVMAELKNIFAPSIEAIKGLFTQLTQAFNNSKGSFISGFESIKNGWVNIGSYLLGEFIPNVTNSFSTNILPIFGDVLSFAIEELALTFEWLGGIFESVSNDIITPALQSIEMVTTDIFDGIKKAWDKSGGELIAQAKVFLEGLREDLEEFYNDVILPIWKKLQEVFDKVWTEGLKPLWDEVVLAATEIGACILQLYNEFIKPIVDWLQKYIYPIIVKVINNIIDNVGKAITTIAGIIKGIVTVIKGIVQFITGVFTGDWKKAWEGVKNIFKGVFDSLVAVIKTPLNRIIDGINTMVSGIVSGVNTAIRAINKLSFTVPDWVPGIGGKKFGFDIKELTAPKIPKLATGGIVDAATIAMIGERGKEAVLPLENNTDWMDKLADKIAARNSAPSKIVLMLDGKELGWANINSINSITAQTGKLQLSLY